MHARANQGDASQALKRELNSFSDSIDGRGNEDLPKVESSANDE
jgi:hypothetical protein